MLFAPDLARLRHHFFWEFTQHLWQGGEASEREAQNRSVSLESYSSTMVSSVMQMFWRHARIFLIADAFASFAQDTM
jgi:hypothetical protein